MFHPWTDYITTNRPGKFVYNHWCHQGNEDSQEKARIVSHLLPRLRCRVSDKFWDCFYTCFEEENNLSIQLYKYSTNLVNIVWMIFIWDACLSSTTFLYNASWLVFKACRYYALFTSNNLSHGIFYCCHSTDEKIEAQGRHNLCQGYIIYARVGLDWSLLII